MSNTTIVLVEDDDRLAALVCEYLQEHAFSVIRFSRGDDAVRDFNNDTDLVILDLMLPGMDGLNVCRALRERYQGPIMMLTAKGSDVDQVVGLELGADDYVTKPVEPRLLLARVRALLRRSARDVQSETGRGEVLNCGGLRLCPATQEVSLKGEPVPVTTQEFDLLHLLARQAGQVVSRDQLYRDLRGIDYDGLDRSIDVCVSHIRRKLRDDQKNPSMIKTVWGRGYLLALTQGDIQ